MLKYTVGIDTNNADFEDNPNAIDQIIAQVDNLVKMAVNFGPNHVSHYSLYDTNGNQVGEIDLEFE